MHNIERQTRVWVCYRVRQSAIGAALGLASVRMPTPSALLIARRAAIAKGQLEPLLGGIAGNRGDLLILRRQTRPPTLHSSPPVGRTTVSSSGGRPTPARAVNLPSISLFPLAGSILFPTELNHLPWFQALKSTPTDVYS